MKLIDLLKDFHPRLTMHGDNFEITSHIFVLSQLEYKGKLIFFGYIENLTGGHSWIKMISNEANLKEIEFIVESAVALRTQA